MRPDFFLNSVDSVVIYSLNRALLLAQSLMCCARLLLLLLSLRRAKTLLKNCPSFLWVVRNVSQHGDWCKAITAII